MNLGAETRWLLLSFRRFSSRSTTRATRKVLSVLLNPAQQMISRICHSPSQPVQTPHLPREQRSLQFLSGLIQCPPSPLIPSSDSAVTPPLSLHLGSLDKGLPHVGLTGRGLCSSHTLMQRINRVSFQLNMADCFNELQTHCKTHTLQSFDGSY